MAQQTSIHVQPVKGGSEQHNKREKELDYVRTDLSHLNEYWEKDTQTNRLENIKSRYLMSTGQKMQAKATPIREAVVVIKPETTMDDLKKLSETYRQRFGIDTFQIAIHKDEGYPQVEEWKPNLHAHLVFDWTNQETGKSLKLNRQDMVEMQTITAEILQMDRGVSSDKRHLTAMQYKNEAEKAKLKKLQEQKEQEEKKRKQIKAQQEADLKAYNTKKAVKEAAKSASEGIKGFFGQSSKDKQIKALQSEIKVLREEKEALEAKVRDIPKAVNAAVRERLVAESKRETNNYRALYTAATGKGYLIGNEGSEPKEVLNAIRDLNQRYKKECELATNWCKYAKELEEKEERRWGHSRGLGI